MAQKKEVAMENAAKDTIAESAEVKAAPSKESEVKTEADESPKKRGRKPGNKNASDNPQEVKKTASRKTAAAKKTTTRKAAAKKEGLIPEVYLQYKGGESGIADLVEKIKQQFMNEGHRAGNIKDLQIYVKPEENAAYYVINEKNAGKVDLF